MTAVVGIGSGTALAPTGADAPLARPITTDGPLTDLLRIAVERGAPVEQLEKLVDLHERMEQRQAARDFSAAFAAFQAECPSIVKNREGKVVTNKGGS